MRSTRRRTELRRGCFSASNGSGWKAAARHWVLSGDELLGCKKAPDLHVFGAKQGKRIAVGRRGDERLMNSETLIDALPARDGIRPPPKQVTLLLPVWGYRFVSQFLEFCLPTLLASGNVPAVAAVLPTRFVVLSRADDEELIRSHPAWLALQRVCDAEIELIDDLITNGNHTTTITLAFARAVRQSKEDMTDICFIFLMSDYLFADGGLLTLARHFLAGVSGIVAGNFQIVAEDASASLPFTADPTTCALTLPSRELLAWSLSYLHPATTANIVNFRLSHNVHTNRLLWRVDENTLIGRFYLIHPIGIRPEVTDFVVGSSLDYSFIPEMCSPENVVTLTDSDDYFVVEMQPRLHESSNLRAGPIQEAELAASLSEWTTVQHRSNVAQTVVYHATDVSPNLPQAIAEADEFIDRVSELLAAKPPQPYRNHPYWAGAIASNRLQTGQALSKEDWHFLLGEALPSAGLRGLIWRIRRRIFGAPPDVTRVHTRWPDYNLPREALRQILSDNGKLLLVTDRPSRFAQWMSDTTSDVSTIEWDRLAPPPLGRAPSGIPEWYRRLLDNFDACLVVATEPLLVDAGAVINRLSPLLKAAGQMFIMVINDRPYHNAAQFRDVFVQRSIDLLDLSSWVLEVHYVPASRMRWLIYRASDRVLLFVRTAYVKSSMKVLPFWGVLLVPLTIATYFVNSGIRSTLSPPHGLWSSVFLSLRRTRQPDRDELFADAARAWSAAKTIGSRDDAPPAAPDSGDNRSSARGGSVEDKGPSIAAAHNVAAKLLAGRPDVAVYGFDDGDGVHLARYNVNRLSVYDPGFAVGQGRRNVAGLEVSKIRHHDILSGPLPRNSLHGAICSLGTLIYISRADEELYVGNLAASLIRNEGILILGCPSSATEDEIAAARDDRSRVRNERRWMIRGEVVSDRASLQNVDPENLVLSRVSERNRLYPRTSVQLKNLAERFFGNVLLFSIVYGMLYPGAVSAADYSLVVCCSKK
jgi:hypothetical protein